jgi:hypothetical protein
MHTLPDGTEVIKYQVNAKTGLNIKVMLEEVCDSINLEQKSVISRTLLEMLFIVFSFSKIGAYYFILGMALSLLGIILEPIVRALIFFMVLFIFYYFEYEHLEYAMGLIKNEHF